MSNSDTKNRADIEKYIISSLQDEETYKAVIEHNVSEIYFKPGTHRDLFKISVNYFNKYGKCLTPRVLVERANDFGFASPQVSNMSASFRNIQNIEYDHNEVPFYMDKLKEYLAGDVLRETMHKAIEVSKSGGQEPNQKALEEVTNIIQQNKSFLESDTIVRRYSMSDIENILKQELIQRKFDPEKFAGVKCGIKEVDRAFGAGLRDGELTLFMAPPGGGKTTVMLSVADAIWRNYNKNIIYASLEMSVNRIAMKHLSANSLVKINRLESAQFSKNTKDTLDRVFLERRDLTEKAIFDVWDIASSGKVKTSILESEIKKSLPYAPIDVLFVDYLELLEPDNPNLDFWIKMGDICKFLRGIGKKYGFTVISAVQLKRSAIDRIRKSKSDEIEFDASDAQGSNQISADADRIYGLIFDANNERFIEMVTAKDRYNKKVKISLYFDGDCSRIYGDNTDYQHEKLISGDDEFDSIVDQGNKTMKEVDAEMDADLEDDDFQEIMSETLNQDWFNDEQS